jgi:hypothetical protein
LEQNPFLTVFTMPSILVDVLRRESLIYVQNAVPSVGAASSTTTKKTKLGGLGATKGAVKFDFAEAERKALEEAERVRQLGYDR